MQVANVLHLLRKAAKESGAFKVRGALLFISPVLLM